MRASLLLASLLAATMLSCRSNESGDAAGRWDRFWIHPAGTKWDFDAAFTNESGPAKRRAEFRVTRSDSQGTRYEYDLFNPPDPGATASMDDIWYVHDGYLVWGSEDVDEVTPYWRVFKLGAKKGDQWTGPPGEGTVKHLGVEEITVPAGTFSAIHIRIDDAEDGKTHDFWWAATEGLVRWNTKGPDGTAEFVLRRYQRGR